MPLALTTTASSRRSAVFDTVTSRSLKSSQCPEPLSVPLPSLVSAA
jgi:hypothetical protein